LVLVGRTESDLLETEKLVPTSTQVMTFACSVSDEKGMNEVAHQVGTWDILIMGAAHEPTPGPTIEQDLSDWWQAYEVSKLYWELLYHCLDVNIIHRPM
jgi:NADP-dependent 3-hydroxy acid dehydrogenase YdfG